MCMDSVWLVFIAGVVFSDKAVYGVHDFTNAETAASMDAVTACVAGF